jgi:nucleoside-diphosphate-sugar epimerase
MSLFNHKPVLVTGATGFLGGRLVEKLILYHAAPVRVLARNLGHATRLVRLPVELARGDMSEALRVDKAAAGCAAVFHCAHDWHSGPANLAGARNLVEACARHGVRRLVYVSSLAVYGWPDGDVRETTPFNPYNEYARNKLEVEDLLLSLGRERNVDVVVLQPSCIYGPFSQGWTVEPVVKMRLGKLVLPGRGEGSANCVYVDDLVDALILAATRPGVAGERYIISDAAPCAWSEFFGAYEKMLGQPALSFMAADQIRAALQPRPTATQARLAVTDPRRLLQWPPAKRLYRWARRHLPRHLVDRVKRTAPPPVFLPSLEFLKVYECRTVARIDKARRQLGYAPRFPLPLGMAVTAEFVKRTTL